VKSSEIGETIDLGNDEQFIVFVRDGFKPIWPISSNWARASSDTVAVF